VFASISRAQDGCDERRSSAGSVGGQHQVELVVDTHQLLDTRLHDVREVRVVPEDRAVDCNNLQQKNCRFLINKVFLCVLEIKHSCVRLILLVLIFEYDM